MIPFSMGMAMLGTIETDLVYIVIPLTFNRCVDSAEAISLTFGT